MEEIRIPDGRVCYEGKPKRADMAVDYWVWCPICYKRVPAYRNFITGELIPMGRCYCVQNEPG